MANYKIYLENGRVVISPTSSGVTATRSSLSVYPQTLQFPADGYLTASVVNTTQVKVVTATGTSIFNGIAPSVFRTAAGAAIGSTAAEVVNLLNSSTYFGFSTDFAAGIATNASDIATNTSDIETAQTAIISLQKTVKTTTGDRGVYLNDNKYTSESFLNLTSTAAKLQAGPTGGTYYSQGEGSSGTHTFVVQAGSPGNETAVTALTIEGSTTFNTALITFNQPATGLSASAVTSGTFSTARIPNLSASKITTGTFADARIAESNVTQHIVGIETNFSQLRQNLDVGTYGFQTSATNQDIRFTPSGTGSVHVDGTLKLKQHTAAPTAFDGGMYADDAGNLYFGVS